MDKLKTNILDLSNKIKLKPTESLLEELSDLFRELRTVCATTVEIRKTLFDSIIELKSMKELLETLYNLSFYTNKFSSERNCHQEKQPSKTAFQCMLIGLQVIGNTIVQNDVDCVKHIWDRLKDFLQDCYEYEHGDEKLNNILMMIFYNVYKCLPNIAEDSTVRDTFITQAKAQNEFAFYFLDDFIYSQDKSGTKFKLFFDSLESRQKQIVLEYIKHRIKPGLEMEYFIQMFNRDIFRILKDEPYHEDEALATVINLELLTELSASQIYQNTLQNNGTFVSNAFEFLKTMHLLGKQDTHKFAPDPNLSHLFDPQTLHFEPCFGLKTSCVNLVANLCWLHRANQDYARNSELLPVLLECCNIDAKNPLLKEHAVFAIANCCKNNTTNQEYIANLNKKGDYSFDSQSGINLATGVNIGTLKKEGEKSS